MPGRLSKGGFRYAESVLIQSRPINISSWAFIGGFMRRQLLIALAFVLSFATASARAADDAKSLKIYFIDVEGGQSTLVVDPAGEALLVDTGWAGFNGRDADRIQEAAKAAGVQKIDVAVITHYHGDHVGGAPEIAKRVKIETFVDHGADAENSDRTKAGYAAYQEVASQAKRIIAKPGEQLPLRGMRVEVLAAAGQAIQSPVSGAGKAN